jgi:hypothetical protein
MTMYLEQCFAEPTDSWHVPYTEKWKTQSFVQSHNTQQRQRFSMHQWQEEEEQQA